jgi:hypothetical protein
MCCYKCEKQFSMSFIKLTNSYPIKLEFIVKHYTQDKANCLVGVSKVENCGFAMGLGSIIQPITNFKHSQDK